MKWTKILLFMLLVSTSNIQAQTPVKYKYCTIYYNSPCFGDSYINLYYGESTEKNVNTSIYKLFNKLGEQGWELVATTTNQYDCGTEYEYIFKMKI